MDPKKLYLHFFIAFLAWASLSALGYFYGPKLVKLLEPVYIEIIETAHPEYEARIDYDLDGHEQYIELYVTAIKAIDYAPGQSLPAGRSIGPTKITIFHTMVPLVIFGVIVLAWPANSLREFILRLAFAIPGTLIVTGITSPFQLLGLLDTAFIQAAAQVNFAYESGNYEWMRFTEGGARWLIPILVGILCSWGANKLIGNKG